MGSFFLQVMMIKPLIPLLITSVGVLFILSGCVMNRTVTEGGRVTEEKNVIKRPVRDFINNPEFD